MRSISKVREQTVIWLEHAREGSNALTTEWANTPMTTPAYREKTYLLARLDGTIDTLKDVLKFIDGEPR